jgi:hypothetical protein
LIDRKDLLVKIKTPGLNENDDDDDQEEEKQDSNFDMLSDSSSSIADDEPVHLNEIYANIGDQIDGKHRIKIKGDAIKIKGRSKIIDKNFSQSNNLIRNSRGEPDLTSFDFLNEYEE